MRLLDAMRASTSCAVKLGRVKIGRLKMAAVHFANILHCGTCTLIVWSTVLRLALRSKADWLGHFLALFVTLRTSIKNLAVCCQSIPTAVNFVACPAASSYCINLDLTLSCTLGKVAVETQILHPTELSRI